MHLHVYFSNSLEIHYAQLKRQLFAGSTSPFRRRLIVVYGPAMQSWLMQKMAQDPDLGIAIGIEFVYLKEAYQKLLQLSSSPSRLHIPTPLELALAIESELTQLLSSRQPSWDFLFRYLHLEETESPTLTPKRHKRLVRLSQQLAHLFCDYGRFATPLIQQWQGNASHWQALLWQRLFNNRTGWTTPAAALSRPLSPLPHCEIHFFSISFISRLEFTFFESLASTTPLHYYLLSPCAAFWSDIASDKESGRLFKYWQQQGKGLSDELLQLEEFLRDRNPLLANFGRLGREMVTQIEEGQTLSQAAYQLSENVQTLALDIDLEGYEDLHLVPRSHPLTLLEAIQADMLLLRNPDKTPLTDLPYQDTSLQLHQTPTPRREVQILYHNLLKIIEQHPEIHPSDIIVMAPQINDYAHFIRAQFGSPHSQLDYQLLDQGLQQQELVQGFMQLIALSESRWDVTQLLQLFENRAFRRRHPFSSGEYTLLHTWIEKAAIFWGEDASHRDELLLRNHCQQGMFDLSEVGTWELGFTRLMLALTTLMNDKAPSHLPLGVQACDPIEFSHYELLSRWMHLLHALRDDLAPLHDGTRMQMEEWIHYLTCLLESYFQPDYENKESQQEHEELTRQFGLLQSAAKSCSSTLFPFYTVKTHLMELLTQRGLVFRENHLQAVRFCSMLPLRSIPAKVIAILGLQEGTFPRQNSYSSLNLMHECKECDYCPSATDYDRYLFLEAIHSAQSFLLLSYQGYSSKDQKELRPCLLVEELFSYLDKYYTLQQQQVSSLCWIRHPFDSFDPAYFQPGTSLANYSHTDYLAALVSRQISSETSSNYFQLQDDIPPTSITSVELKHLSALARNPIKFYLNRGLQIYLESAEERTLPKAEQLTLSPLSSYQLREQILKEPLEVVFQRAEKSGKLPLGLFKSVVYQKMKAEETQQDKALAKQGIDQLFQIEFCPHTTQTTQVAVDQWKVPAPQIYCRAVSFFEILSATASSDRSSSSPMALAMGSSFGSQGGFRRIVGTLPFVSIQGLVTQGKTSLEDIWKVWPHFLLYLYALPQLPFVAQPQLIGLQAAKPKKSFLSDPLPHLANYLHYYDHCHQQISPLMPTWIGPLSKGDATALQQKIEELITRNTQREVNWVFHNQPQADEIITHWKAPLETLAGELLAAWYPAKAKEGDDE